MPRYLGPMGAAFIFMVVALLEKDNVTEIYVRRQIGDHKKLLIMPVYLDEECVNVAVGRRSALPRLS